MDMNDVKTGAEIVKDSSEALKNFQEIIGKFLEPRGIDAAVIEGHKKIIEDYVAREDIDEFTKMAFLSSYKKTMKAILPPEAKSTLNAHIPTICHRLHSDCISRYLHWLVEPD